MKFVVQGFGNVGSWAARILHDEGAKLVAVETSDGAIHSGDGIDPHALYRHLNDESGRLEEFPGGEPVSKEELLQTDCDVFIPAALGGMIHKGNAVAPRIAAYELGIARVAEAARTRGYIP